MDGLITLIGFALLLVFVGLPIGMIVAIVKSNNNKNEIDRLKQHVKQLTEEVKRFSQSSAISSSEHQLTVSASEQKSGTKTDPVISQVLPTASSVQRVEKPPLNDAMSANVRPELGHITASPVEPVDETATVAQSVSLTPVGENPEFEHYGTSIALSVQPAKAQQPSEVAPQPKVSGKSTENHVKQPATSTDFGGIFSSLFQWFIKENPLAKLGVLLLFLGLSYLMKFAIENDMFPVEFYFIGAAMISAGLLVVGWRLRLKKPVFALIVQGGAVGALYITTFGAFKLFALLPYLLTFVLMLVICAASVALAVLQRSLSLAMVASIGGYLAPILLSDNSGNYVGLFSYYLLISLGILAVSMKQSWRELNLLGLLFTFGVAALWGERSYEPAFYLNCQLFLIANILIFGVFAVCFSLRQQPKGKEIVDGILVFVPPIVGFGMQYVLVKHWTYGPAFSALGFGFFYIVLGWLAVKRRLFSSQQLVLSALAIGAGFVTLAIPLALSAKWTSMAWSVEGLAVLWIGLNQQQKRMSWAGVGILGLAAISALPAFQTLSFEWYTTKTESVISFFLIFSLLFLAYLAASVLWWRHHQNESKQVARGFLIATLIVGIILSAGGAHFLEIDRIPESLRFLVLFLVVVLVCHSAGRRLKYTELRTSVWLLWPVMAIVLVWESISWPGIIWSGYHMSDSGWSLSYFVSLCCWAVALILAWWLLRRESDSLAIHHYTDALHLALFWITTAKIGAALYYLLFVVYPPVWGREEWWTAAVMMFFTTTILVVAWLHKRQYWPFSLKAELYWTVGLLPAVLFLAGILLWSNIQDGQMYDWFYLPVINPLELSALFGLAALLLWSIRLRLPEPAIKKVVQISIIALIIWWAHGILLRLLSHYLDVYWSLDAIWDSRWIQAILALIWTVSALTCMIWSTRHQHRQLWIAGAVILGMAIIKLLLVDSGRGGGLARAIAFIGVSLLVLVVGYFSPLPPKNGEEEMLEGKK